MADMFLASQVARLIGANEDEFRIRCLLDEFEMVAQEIEVVILHPFREIGGVDPDPFSHDCDFGRLQTF
jgi:hypothetical protein